MKSTTHTLFISCLLTLFNSAVLADSSLREAKDTALKEMQDQAMRLGADAVIGIDLDYETVGAHGGMLMVTASGTAVRF